MIYCLVQVVVVEKFISALLCFEHATVNFKSAKEQNKVILKAFSKR